MSETSKNHFWQHKGKYSGGITALAGALYIFFQLNLSIPALQRVPNIENRVIVLETRLDNQRAAQAKLTEEISLLRKTIEQASIERTTVITKLDIIVSLQKENRDDIKELIRSR